MDDDIGYALPQSGGSARGSPGHGVRLPRWPQGVPQHRACRCRYPASPVHASISSHTGVIEGREAQATDPCTACSQQWQCLRLEVRV